MRLLRCFPIVFVVLMAVARAAERDIVRTFDAAASCTVSIDTFRGPITVTESDAAQVRVAVHLEIGAETETEAEQMLASFSLQMTGSGATVTVIARDPRQTGPRLSWNEKKQIEPTFRITVPTTCNLVLRTRTGSIVVGNVCGHLQAEAETGDVFFRRVTGDVRASSGTGDIVISRCIGSASARTRLGTIRVGTVTGACDLNNGSGDVEVLVAKSDLRVFAEAGNASVGLSGDFSGKADVTTSGGSIIAAIDPGANCEIEASASFLAHVESTLPLKLQAGRAGSRRLSGVLNRGGHRVELRASGGNIKLLPRPAPFE